jgi:hypothetical protein
MRRAPASLCLIACAVLGSSVGCGGGDDDAEQAKDVAALQRQIDADAKRAGRTGGKERTVLPLADAKTDVPATTTATTTQPAPAPLPAAARTPPRRPASRALLSPGDRASFERLAAQLPGEEGVAVTTLGRGRAVSRVGSLRAGVAWSTAKVPVAMAAIGAGVARSGDLVQAITASDNAAAERLWSALGEGSSAAAAATDQLRAAGDEVTEIQAQRLRPGYTAFGQTTWRLTDQARFVGGMRCARSGPQVLKLMNEVVAGQRWGLGSTGKPAQFKAGWGPGVTAGSGDGWLDRQMGIVRIGGRPVAVAMATTASGHETGTSALTRIAKWVVTHVNSTLAPRDPQCG